MNVGSRWKVQHGRRIKNTDNIKTKNKQEKQTTQNTAKQSYFSRLLGHSAGKRGGLTSLPTLPNPHIQKCHSELVYWPAQSTGKWPKLCRNRTNQCPRKTTLDNPQFKIVVRLNHISWSEFHVGATCNDLNLVQIYDQRRTWFRDLIDVDETCPKLWTVVEIRYKCFTVYCLCI